MSYTIDKCDDAIGLKMAANHMLGLSVTLFKNGDIVGSKSYGFCDISPETQVVENTVFQAGSISKFVTSILALKLVERGFLNLDADICSKLTSWTIKFDVGVNPTRVTLRQILSHTAGFSVHGFRGYRHTDQLPNLLQILDGKFPSNNAPIIVINDPGTVCKYSGGGFTVLQQLLSELSSATFEELVYDNVFQPIGLNNSNFKQPNPNSEPHLIAHGFDHNNIAVPNGWNIYPELVAAGLWTTSADLAKLSISVCNALVRQEDFLSKDLVCQMFDNKPFKCGLGVFVDESKGQLCAYHTGRNAGFDSFLLMYPKLKCGIILMTNKNVKQTLLVEIAKIFFSKIF